MKNPALEIFRVLLYRVLATAESPVLTLDSAEISTLLGMDLVYLDPGTSRRAQVPFSAGGPLQSVETVGMGGHRWAAHRGALRGFRGPDSEAPFALGPSWTGHAAWSAGATFNYLTEHNYRS